MTWISITKAEMMRDTMSAFTTELRELDPNYEMYDKGGSKLYIKTTNKAFEELTDSWFFYHPISALENKPDVSDDDLIE